MKKKYILDCFSFFLWVGLFWACSFDYEQYQDAESEKSTSPSFLMFNLDYLGYDHGELSYRLTGERMERYEKRKFMRIFEAQFEKFDDQGERDFRGKAGQIDYNEEKKSALLQKNVEIFQFKDQFSLFGDYFTWDEASNEFNSLESLPVRVLKEQEFEFFGYGFSFQSTQKKLSFRKGFSGYFVKKPPSLLPLPASLDPQSTDSVDKIKNTTPLENMSASELSEDQTDEPSLFSLGFLRKNPLKERVLLSTAFLVRQFSYPGLFFESLLEDPLRNLKDWALFENKLVSKVGFFAQGAGLSTRMGVESRMDPLASFFQFRASFSAQEQISLGRTDLTEEGVLPERTVYRGNEVDIYFAAGREEMSIVGDVFVQENKRILQGMQLLFQGKNYERISSQQRVFFYDQENELVLEGEGLYFDREADYLRLSGKVILRDQKNQVIVHSEFFEGRLKQEEYAFSSNVFVQGEDFSASSDRLFYDQSKDEVFLRGNILFFRKKDLFRAQEMRYNLKSEDFTQERNLEGEVFSS